MNTQNNMSHPIKHVMVIWISSSIIITSISYLILQADFPLFIYLNLAISLIIILKTNNFNQYSLRMIKKYELLKFTSANLVPILIIYAIIEPWTHLYDELLMLSITDGVDVTFGWITHYPRLIGFFFILVFSGFISIFSEELMFRGILEGYLLKKTNNQYAIIIQAFIFTIPQSLVAFILPLTDGILYIIFYSFVGIGIVNGIIVFKSKSIFPSLIFYNQGKAINIAESIN